MPAIKMLDAIKQCRNCKLSTSRRNVVLGRGVLPCDLLAIGEAPGTAEDLLDEAFVGESGKLLDGMMAQAGFTTAHRVYFTNTVLCRPTDRKGGENREPTANEILMCSANVGTVINWAQPKEVLLIGDVARKYFRKTFPRAFYIHHPAYLLRTGGTMSPYYLKNIRILEDLNARL